MRPDNVSCSSFSPQKHKPNHVFVKFAISFFLVGLAFRLLVPDSIRFSASSSSSVAVETPHLQESNPGDSREEEEEPPLPVQTTQIEKDKDLSYNLETNVSQNSTCDIFIGEWVPDPSGPFYANDTCHDIEAHQNCMKNGRPDSGYLYWRWKPRDCELPRFDPAKFLKIMKNKWWAFIGDSISRNHVQSLLCILSKGRAGMDW